MSRFSLAEIGVEGAVNGTIRGGHVVIRPQGRTGDLTSTVDSLNITHGSTPVNDTTADTEAVDAVFEAYGSEEIDLFAEQPEEESTKVTALRQELSGLEELIAEHGEGYRMSVELMTETFDAWDSDTMLAVKKDPLVESGVLTGKGRIRLDTGMRRAPGETLRSVVEATIGSSGEVIVHTESGAIVSPENAAWARIFKSPALDQYKMFTAVKRDGEHPPFQGGDMNIPAGAYTITMVSDDSGRTIAVDFPDGTSQ